MTATELYYAAATGLVVSLLLIIAGHLRAIRGALAPAVAPSLPVQAPADAPRPGMHSLAGVERRGEHAGRAYAVHGDGVVVAPYGDGFATWRNEQEFRAWADRTPLRTDDTPA